MRFFGAFDEYAVLSLSWEQVSLREQAGSARSVALPRRASEACLPSLACLRYAFTTRSSHLGLCHFTFSSLELFVSRYVIDGGLAFLHPALTLFSTSCVQADPERMGCGLGHFS